MGTFSKWISQDLIKKNNTIHFSNRKNRGNDSVGDHMESQIANHKARQVLATEGSFYHHWLKREKKMPC